MTVVIILYKKFGIVNRFWKQFPSWRKFVKCSKFDLLFFYIMPNRNIMTSDELCAILI